MKDVSRAGLINVYVENRNVPVFSNIVILDVDVHICCNAVHPNGDFVYADNEPSCHRIQSTFVSKDQVIK